MTEREIAIAINSRLRDIIEETQMDAPTGFSMAFSNVAARCLIGGVHLQEAIDRALQEEGGTFRHLNKGRIEFFSAELVDRLSPVVQADRTLFDVLREFKRYAERELAHGFKGKNRNEEYCRSNLQTHLQRLGETRREVVSGGGLIDILIATGEPVEAKLWNGAEYYAAGVEELREYMRTENERVGYYVVFDTLADNPNLPEHAELEVPEGRIIVMAVRMSPGPPSKRRRSKRTGLAKA